MPAPDDDANHEPASDAPETLVRAAARLQPALGIDGEIRRVWQPPAGASWYRILNPWPAMVPLFDLASARAVARLAGAPDIPSPPLAKNSAGR